jgi:hypothetical protein
MWMELQRDAEVGSQKMMLDQTSVVGVSERCGWRLRDVDAGSDRC